MQNLGPRVQDKSDPICEFGVSLCIFWQPKNGMWVVIASPEYMVNVIWYTRSILVEIADLKGFCGLKKCCASFLFNIVKDIIRCWVV